MELNQGFDGNVVAAYKAKCNPFGFVLHAEEERTPEYAHVYFTGTYEGRDVVYDTVLYTLRLEYETEIYSIVEEMTRKKFPEYTTQVNDDAEDEDTEPPEEIAMHMAEIILSLEEDESVRVQEHAELDLAAGFGIGLDVGLHVEEITDERIAGFIRDFNKGDLKLDPTLYTFQFSDSDGG